jgi:hypothetical protein
MDMQAGRELRTAMKPDYSVEHYFEETFGKQVAANKAIPRFANDSDSVWRCRPLVLQKHELKAMRPLRMMLTLCCPYLRSYKKSSPLRYGNTDLSI